MSLRIDSSISKSAALDQAGSTAHKEVTILEDERAGKDAGVFFSVTKGP